MAGVVCRRQRGFSHLGLGHIVGRLESASSRIGSLILLGLVQGGRLLALGIVNVGAGEAGCRNGLGSERGQCIQRVHGCWWTQTYGQQKGWRRVIVAAQGLWLEYALVNR